MASLAVRITIVTISLVALGWTALSIRALDLDAEGREVSATVQNGEISAAELERGRNLFQDARRFHADKTPLMDEAFLLTVTRRGEEALALTETIVEDEPDNRDAWVFVYLAARAAGDRQARARAARAIRELDPRNAELILRRTFGG